MVIWTGPAKSHLRQIHDFIAVESRYYASKVSTDIINKTEILNDFPFLGRKVPEVGSDHIRELQEYSYRIIYRVEPLKIYILAVLHSKRDFQLNEK